ELRPALSIRAAAGYGDSVARGFPDDSGGPRHAVLRELEEREARTRHVSLQAEWRPALGAVEAQCAWFARDGAEDSPGVAGGVRDPVGLPALAARTGYRRDELQATWRSPLGARRTCRGHPPPARAWPLRRPHRLRSLPGAGGVRHGAQYRRRLRRTALAPRRLDRAGRPALGAAQRRRHRPRPRQPADAVAAAAPGRRLALGRVVLAQFAATELLRARPSAG